MDRERTAYDEVLYPGHPFDQTHPDRLATIGALFGLEPARIDRCRVLELGCGRGGNLIPMAAQLPDSEFIGIDLSEAAIGQGLAQVADLGLGNLTLRHFNIMDVTEEFGTFDYIIAHGVYSWVPPFVREKILAIYKQHLAPQGVGYISYNCYPGSHMRDLTRRMMLYHVQRMDDPREKVQQARGLLKTLAEATPEDTIYGAVLRDRNETVKKLPDEVLFHDDLDADATAFFVHQVAGDAARNGLQYVSEATIAHTQFGWAPDAVANVLKQIPAGAFVAREQYRDFFVGCGFRESLFCHAEVELRRTLEPERVRRYHIASHLEDAAEEIDPSGPGVATFTAVRGVTVSTDHPLSKAALLCLRESWPQALHFDDLLERALARLGPREAAVRANMAAEVETLTDVLFGAFCCDRLDLHLFPPRLTAQVSERPLVSALARYQVGQSPIVTTLRHTLAKLEDEDTRRFLPLVDGSRTLDELAADFTAANGGTGGAPQDSAGENAGREITPVIVEQNLRLLARLGLLQA